MYCRQGNMHTIVKASLTNNILSNISFSEIYSIISNKYKLQINKRKGRKKSSYSWRALNSSSSVKSEYTQMTWPVFTFSNN
jgi:hypothetical protein